MNEENQHIKERALTVLKRISIEEGLRFHRLHLLHNLRADFAYRQMFMVINVICERGYMSREDFSQILEAMPSLLMELAQKQDIFLSEFRDNLLERRISSEDFLNMIIQLEETT